MAIRVGIPNSLISVLWSRYLPRAAFTFARQDPQLGQCHGSKRNVILKDAYEESYNSLRALKDLRRAVCSLRHVINEGVQKMEKELLPVSRHHGIRTLPSEIMVKIMSLVGKQPDMTPESFKTLMFMFFEAQPFNAHVLDAKELVVRLKGSDKSCWEGRLPPEKQEGFRAGITKFHFSTKNSYSLTDIQVDLRPLKGLEELSITCSFDDDKISKGPDVIVIATVQLPRLRSLSVSNVTDFSSKKFTKPYSWKAWSSLRRVVRMLDMPSVNRIRADLRKTEDSWNGGPQLNILDELFSFPDHKYPNVTFFKIDSVECGNCTAYKYLNLSAAFCSLPSLESLQLGSCDTVHYKITKDPDSPIPNLNLRWLKLRYDQFLTPRWTCLIMKHFNDWVSSCKALESIDVDTPYDEVFDWIKSRFTIAQRVSGGSILDRTDWSDSR